MLYANNTLSLSQNAFAFAKNDNWLHVFCMHFNFKIESILQCIVCIALFLLFSFEMKKWRCNLIYVVNVFKMWEPFIFQQVDAFFTYRKENNGVGIIIIHKNCWSFVCLKSIWMIWIWWYIIYQISNINQVKEKMCFGAMLLNRFFILFCSSLFFVLFHFLSLVFQFYWSTFFFFFCRSKLWGYSDEAQYKNEKWKRTPSNWRRNERERKREKKQVFSLEVAHAHFS